MRHVVTPKYNLRHVYLKMCFNVLIRQRKFETEIRQRTISRSFGRAASMTWAYFVSVFRSNLFTRISGRVGTVIRSSRLLGVLCSIAKYHWRNSSVSRFTVSVRTLLKIVLCGTLVPGSALRASLVPYRLENEDHFICRIFCNIYPGKIRIILRLLQILT
jgi:hypothetical protein